MISQSRRNGIPHHFISILNIAVYELEIVRKSLYSGTLSNAEATIKVFSPCYKPSLISRHVFHLWRLRVEWFILCLRLYRERQLIFNPLRRRRKQSLAERERHSEGENEACEKRTSLAKGRKKPVNREKGTGKQGERYYLTRFRRPPLQIRAGALTSWSTRPFMLERTAESDFYSLVSSFFGKYSQRRLSRTFHRRGCSPWQRLSR